MCYVVSLDTFVILYLRIGLLYCISGQVCNIVSQDRFVILYLRIGFLYCISG